MPRPATRVGVVLAALAITLGSSGCAVKLYEPPSGPGQPFPEAPAVWRDVTTGCRDAQRFVVEIHVDGWAGEGDARQRLPNVPMHTALTRDDDMYLEVPAPGKSYVQMAGRGGQSVFLLPREDRVLRAPARDIIDRLIGLRWGARDLLNVISGCVTTPSGELKGTTFGKQASIELGGDARAYLRQQNGRWQLVAADRDGFRIEYREYAGTWPSLIRVSSVATTVTPLSLRFTISQHYVNTTLEENTFVLEVPSAFLPMSLDELRSVKPLRDVKGGGASVSRKPQ
jgi:hypothetical protein